MTLLDQTQDVRSSFKSADYFALNAQLNQWVTDADGNKVIPFEKDKEAARVYMIDHVNANMWWHHDLEEKLRFLVDNEYWEKEFLEKYDPAFVKKLFQHAYSKKFRFPTFMSAYKFYSAYALKSFDGKRYLERYEDRVAAVALYMANGNKKFAMEIVDVAIGSLFQVATPTFMNAGKKQRGELVSCFLLNVDDDLNSIFRGINSAAQLSKRGGGVAFCLTNVRGKGDPIKQIENSAGGILPWMKIFEKTFDAVDQLGTRAGAGAVYLNAHHIDILDFLDSKRENADENVRIKTLSLGVVIPDITFELARAGEEMYLFSPYDISKEYGKEMAWISVSEEYRTMVDNPRIRKEKVPGGARRFLTMLAEVQMESGYPYVLFEDAANRHNMVGGKIIMSNLCSEILQPSEPSVLNDDLSYGSMGKDISCNLGSFNMLKLVESGSFGKHVETAVRMLTFVSDASDISSVPTVASGNRRSHSVGIGAMNLQGMFGHFEIEYGSEESIDLTSAYFQTLTYHAVKASNAIARERKETFDGFEKSKYATGEYFERYTTPEAQALLAVKTDKVRAIFAANNIEIPTLADWESLRESVKKYGMYNAHLQAVAPTGSISYIANATPSLLPITSRAETRKEGKLKAIFMAPEMNMHNIAFFKTAYEIPAQHVIDIYSVAEYFIDQSASLTVHLPAKSGPKQINQMQVYAFSKGKPSSKARDERGQMLDKYVSSEIRSLYYYRLESDILVGTNEETVASSNFSECIACAL